MVNEIIIFDHSHVIVVIWKRPRLSSVPISNSNLEKTLRMFFGLIVSMLRLKQHSLSQPKLYSNLQIWIQAQDSIGTNRESEGMGLKRCWDCIRQRGYRRPLRKVYCGSLVCVPLAGHGELMKLKLTLLSLTTDLLRLNLNYRCCWRVNNEWCVMWSKYNFLRGEKDGATYL